MTRRALRLAAAPRLPGAMIMCRRASDAGPPTAAADPSAATATGCYLSGDVPSPLPGHRWRRPPAVATGDPAGQRSPVRSPIPCDGGSPSQPPRKNPSAPAPAAGQEGSFTPPRPRPPRARGGSPQEMSYRTDAGAPAPRPVPAGVGPRRPPRVPAVTLVPLPLPFAACVHLSLVLGRPAPDPVQLVRRQGVLEALGTHPASGADRLRPGCLARPRPVRGDWEEQLRIRLKAGGRAPPVTPFLR
jgi:hypothetical protein